MRRPSTGLRSPLPLFLFVTLVLLAPPALLPPGRTAAQTRRIYVRPTASAGGGGISWADATTLRSALQIASPGTEIWAAAGVYTPGPDPLDSFVIGSGVALYGGFAGSESTRDQRNPTVHQTVLSGDIGADDTNTLGGVTRSTADIVGVNAQNVVRIAEDAGPTTVLDSVTISGGQAGAFDSNLVSCPQSCGGGLYIGGGSPTVRMVRFVGNQARVNGGGLYVGLATPTLGALTFIRNRSELGGGMFVFESTLTLAGADFAFNEARNGLDSGRGGGLYVGARSALTLTGGTFDQNSAGLGGGGLFVDRGAVTLAAVDLTGNRQERSTAGRGSFGAGGMAVSDGTATLTNVSFTGNFGQDAGGALELLGGLAGAAPFAPSLLTNVSFGGNSGAVAGALGCTGCRLIGTNLTLGANYGASSGGIRTGGGEVLIDLRNTIVWGNRAGFAAPGANPNLDVHLGATLSIASSLIQGLNPAGTDNLDGTQAGNDPRFVSLPLAGAAPTTTLDLRLRAGSPAIDRGSNALIGAAPQPGPAVDVAGVTRILGGAVDLGAYETGGATEALRMEPASDTGVSTTDGITSDTTPEFTGRAASGSSIALSSSLDGPLGAATAELGAWSLIAAPMREGAHQVVALVNGAPLATLSVVVDTSGPAPELRFSPLSIGTNDRVVSITFDEPVYGFDDDDLALAADQPAVTPILYSFWGSGASYDAALLHSYEAFIAATVTVRVGPGAARDTAGNASEAGEGSYALVAPLVEELCVARRAASLPARAVTPAQAARPAQAGGEPIELLLLYRLRDRVLRESAEGRRLSDLYYAHTAEMVRLMVADPALLAQTADTIRLWQPELRALVYGRGQQATISAAQVTAIADLLDALAAAGSPELQQVIAAERAKIDFASLPGKTVDAATIQVIQVDPAQLGLDALVYLPLSIR